MEALSDHFVDFTKMIELGIGGKSEVDDKYPVEFFLIYQDNKTIHIFVCLIILNRCKPNIDSKK